MLTEARTVMLKERDEVSIDKEATQFRGKREVHVASPPEDKV